MSHRPPLELEGKLWRAHVWETAAEPESRDVGRGHLLDAHGVIHLEVNAIEVRCHVARLVDRGGALAEEREERGRRRRRTHVPTRRSTTAREELRDLAHTLGHIRVLEGRTSDTAARGVPRRPLPRIDVGTIDAL